MGMWEGLVQLASVAAVALAVWVRVRSSGAPSVLYWVGVSFGVAVAISSPTAAVLVAVFVLVGVEARSGLLGLLVASSALLGIGLLILGAIISPVAASLVEVTALVLVLASTAVASTAVASTGGTRALRRS